MAVVPLEFPIEQKEQIIFPVSNDRTPIRVKFFINFSCPLSIIAERVMKILAHFNTFSFNQSVLPK
jgi:hypothetical protein